MEVRQTERAYPMYTKEPGLSPFRRQTMLEHGNECIFVTTIGLGGHPPCSEPRRYYDTLAIFGKKMENGTWGIDTDREVGIDARCSFQTDVEADAKADQMHNTVVAEVAEKLQSGSIETKGIMKKFYVKRFTKETPAHERIIKASIFAAEFDPDESTLFYIGSPQRKFVFMVTPGKRLPVIALLFSNSKIGYCAFRSAGIPQDWIPANSMDKSFISPRTLATSLD